jgi:sarcosine oxidase, subunit beta
LTDRSVYAIVEDMGESADVVVVGGGTIGGWCGAFLRNTGAGRVVLLERTMLGRGASSRAAGMVRAQGGTEVAVKLGIWSIDFYRRQHDELGFDSGFVEQGYFMPAFDEDEKRTAVKRAEMQRSLGLDVDWIGPEDAAKLNPTMAKDCCLGGTFAPGDGYIDPPRNVLAYGIALARASVDVREGVEFLGLRHSSGRVTGVETSEGLIDTERVVLTGGPELASVGRLAGVAIPAGGVRHQVAVTEPCPELSPTSHPMVFDVGEGLYWRPEDQGLLFGMSNPDEKPGPGSSVDWQYLETIRMRLADLVPGTRDLALRRVWAATIDYTPDHLPILGPAVSDEGVIEGTTLASAGGHGMMWGPAVARVAADLCLHATTDIVDVSDLGLDRFDENGRSRLAPDPIALPFPERITVN